MPKTLAEPKKKTGAKLEPVPNFIGGKWSTPKAAKTSPVFNPSTGEVIAETPMCGADIVDQAVKDAHREIGRAHV